MMKRLILLVTLSALVQSVFAQTSPAASVPVNGIAVVVNDEVITKLELNDRVRMVEQRLKAQGIALPSPAELRRQIIERLITDRAQLQLAKENGMRVDDAMLDQTLQRMAEQNKMTMPVFRSQVEAEGNSYAQFRNGVREDILLQRVRERELDAKVQVSEQEVTNYLQAQKADKQKNQDIELSHILIRVPDNASTETLEKLRVRADSVLKQVKSGADFSKLAATYSDSPEGLQGGSLGWREQGRFPQLFIDAFADLKDGESTGLIKSPNGFHILKVIARRSTDQSAAGIKQAHVRHIMIKTSPTVSKEQAIHKLQEFKQRLDNGGAKFEDIAKQFSNDSSASKGGDLGWLYPGDVPEFDPVVSALKDGQISDPVETSSGFHLLQLLGTKNDEISLERQRLLARQTIRARKMDEATVDWMRQMRDQAYVDIRSDEQ